MPARERERERFRRARPLAPEGRKSPIDRGIPGGSEKSERARMAGQDERTDGETTEKKESKSVRESNQVNEMRRGEERSLFLYYRINRTNSADASTHPSIRPSI